MSGERLSFGSVGLYVGPDWAVRCSTYPDQAPILGVDGGRMTVTISADRRWVSADAVQFARELASQAARFAAECERLHAAQHTQETGQRDAVPGAAA
jgi:hypothetical protein